jgi:hypothetical protein
MLNCHNFFGRSITPLDDLRGEILPLPITALSPLLWNRYPIEKLTKKTSADRMAKDFSHGVKSEERGTIRYSDHTEK